MMRSMRSIAHHTRPTSMRLFNYTMRHWASSPQGTITGSLRIYSQALLTLSSDAE